MSGVDNVIEISTRLASACEGESNEDILAAIAILLSFLVKQEGPDNGMYLLLQIVSRASELAFDITAEIITQDQLQ
jgi:hypothetical protein